MEIDGTLNESFLSVISEDAPIIPHWEIGTVNPGVEVAEPLDKSPDNKDTTNNTLYECTICDYATKRKSSLSRHMRQSHETDRSEGFKCDDCGKSYTEKFRLANHIEVEHRGKRWICDTCGKSYKSSEALNVHMKVRHTNTAKYKCSICQKTFMERDLYYGHISMHEGTKHYSCNLCKKQYRYKNNLKIHKVSCRGGKKTNALRAGCPSLAKEI